MNLWQLEANSTFQCANCFYNVLISGKPDAIIVGFRIPCVCQECNEIYKFHAFNLKLDQFSLF
jgi:hypothetical protein